MCKQYLATHNHTQVKNKDFFIFVYKLSVFRLDYLSDIFSIALSNP